MHPVFISSHVGTHPVRRPFIYLQLIQINYYVDHVQTWSSKVIVICNKIKRFLI